MSRRMNLGLFTMLPVTHHSTATWKHPRNLQRGYRFDRPEAWQDLGRLIERGCFDFFFSADTAGVYSDHAGSHEPAIRFAGQVPCFEQTTLLTYVAAATRHIGIVPTISINGTPPYIMARRLATLDHMCRGRAGWNVVTGFHKNAAQNLGEDDQLEHDQRYDRAEEYMEVCYQLWNSWDEDAIVMDRAGDVFADPQKVRAINFEGEYFRCKGPLNVPRSPQGRPVITQAGQSSRGIAFAARHGELVFSIQTTLAAMKVYYARLKDEIRAVDRNPEDCKICFAFQPIVGETESIAKEKARLHNGLVNPEAGLVILSGYLGCDLSNYDMDAGIDTLDVEGARGLAQAVSHDGEEVRTLRDIAYAIARSINTPQIVGSGAQVADWMEATMEEVGGDGFLISPISVPSSIEDFVDLVVPELQRRKVMRDGYESDKTFREQLLAY